ncbi:uncharacterized protein LOC129584348 [Paramacrobiotus metropolitanus]|uniref:uncharacterized protein LOC129584348 n=1 Tax=Paramacrobiotus metropolitanus TaxID=2943436 RepID=UPI00244628DD|nr:uncharacterized protein LOC129584348 [Paramacrobiotus metropolitanus]
MIGENERKQSLRGVVVVLSHGLDGNYEMRQLVMDAWQKNNVPDVMCISDISAILLAYTVQTLDRQSINTDATEPVYLLMCNADSEHCRVEFFEVISNSHVIKIHNNCVLWDCFADIRRRVVAAIYEQLLSAGMPEVNQRAQLEEECWSQMAVFDDSLTDKVTIRAPFHQYAVTCTRGMYHAVAAPVIDAIRQRVVSELGRFGIMDANTGNINGKVELLLVGENSRLGLLRTALERITRSQVISGAASYVDDAEAFGAAIASSLAGNSTHIFSKHLIFRLQEGVAFDIDKILKTLPLHDASVDLMQPARDIFISDRQDVFLIGDLHMGYHKKPVIIPGFRLVLSSPKIGSCKVHCISLECSVDDQSVTFMRMLLGKGVRISWCKGRDQKADECISLEVEASFMYRANAGWSALAFFVDNAFAGAYKPFMEEYRAREREMLNAFPSSADADESFPKLSWPSSSSFVALVSDQIPTKYLHGIHKYQRHPSIVTVNQCFKHGLVVVIQQCQEVTGKLQVMGSVCSIEQPHKIHHDSAERDTIVIELTPQTCVRVSFPDEATCCDFLLRCSIFWKWWCKL